MRAKWISITGMLAGGALLLQNGCLGSFWDGFRTGWPSDNRFFNIAVDILNEQLFG